MKIRRSWTALALGAMLAGLMFPSGSASANHDGTIRIQVGAYLTKAPAETMRFYPAELNVHRGDTLNFYGEFHTATLLRTSTTDLEEWKGLNTAKPGDEWHAVQDNPDNPAIPWKLLGDNQFSPRLDCGAADHPCEYAGNEIVDSGLLLRYLQFSDPNQPPSNPGFSVKINALRGTSFWVICRLHPNMVMKVNVVDDPATTTTQAEIDAAKADAIGSDNNAAAVLHKELQGKKRSKKLPNGKKEWTAYAGYDTENFALFDMYPARLEVRKGDRVRYEFAALHHESHTATHPKSHVRNNPFDALLCDPNGDDESGGETMPNFDGPFPSCPQGSVLEIGLPAANVSPSGDGVVKSASDFENSGVGGQLGGSPGRGMEPYSLTFTKPAKAVYKIVCYIHPDMQNVIKVSK